MSLIEDTTPRIVPIEDEDWPAVQTMGRMFYAEAGLLGEFIPEVFRENWEMYIERGYGIVLCLREGSCTTGTIGGFVVPDPCNNDLIASEAFWFMHPDHRGNGSLLLRAFEREARKRGAMRLTMVALFALQSERLAAYYQRAGFVPMETHFIKTL